MHIIEQLISERVQKIMQRPWLWRWLRPVLYKALRYTKAVEMADSVAALSGRQAFKNVAKRLSLSLDISGIEHLPASGPCIIIANHPTGLADGIFVYEALKTHRPDHVFMANADALRVVPNAEDIIIPVEWVKEKRTPAKTRQTLKDLKAAFAGNKAVVIFPSGALAKLSWRGLVDRDWNPTAISMAKKYNIPLIPLRIKSRNSGLYYILSLLHNELRDITLFHELLNKKGQSPRLIFGEPIDPKGLEKNAKSATLSVRKIVERL